MWRIVVVIVMLAGAAVACGDGADGGGDPEAACKAAETMLSALAGQMLLDEIDSTDEDLAETISDEDEAARREFEVNAPDQIAEAWRVTEDISKHSFKVSEREARAAAVDTVNEWIKDECDLLYAID